MWKSALIYRKHTLKFWGWWGSRSSLLSSVSRKRQLWCCTFSFSVSVIICCKGKKNKVYQKQIPGLCPEGFWLSRFGMGSGHLHINHFSGDADSTGPWHCTGLLLFLESPVPHHYYHRSFTPYLLPAKIFVSAPSCHSGLNFNAMFFGGKGVAFLLEALGDFVSLSFPGFRGCEIPLCISLGS